MANGAVFEKAFPYGDDILALPVADLEMAAHWYAEHFAMVEVERRSEPQPTVIMERNGTRIGFSVNGGDSSQDGAAILVSDISCSSRRAREQRHQNYKLAGGRAGWEETSGLLRRGARRALLLLPSTDFGLVPPLTASDVTWRLARARSGRARVQLHGTGAPSTSV